VCADDSQDRRATDDDNDDDHMTAEFEHTNPATRIVYGAGATGRLPELLDDLGVERALVICGRTVAAGPQLAAVRDHLGERYAGVYDGVKAHGGLSGLEAGAAHARDSGADGLISVGGGSTIDSAKCVALLLSIERPLRDYSEQSGQAPPIDGELLPHVAIPTTTGSSCEVMPGAGVRDEVRREKLTFYDRRLAPDIAVLDPEITVHTGPELTATSGVTAVARSIEALYSRDRQPISDALARKALELMAGALPRAVSCPSDLDARGATLIGSMLSGIAADNASVSLAHAFGHAVTARVGLQHGIAHAILLPPAASLCLPAVGAAQRTVAEALGVRSAEDLSPDEAGLRAQRALEALIGGLPIPGRLRDVGVARDDLPDLVDVAMADRMFSYCPRSFERAEVVDLVERVW
jgi:alcohol dehydrogenase class IV